MSQSEEMRFWRAIQWLHACGIDKAVSFDVTKPIDVFALENPLTVRWNEPRKRCGWTMESQQIEANLCSARSASVRQNEKWTKGSREPSCVLKSTARLRQSNL